MTMSSDDDNVNAFTPLQSRTLPLEPLTHSVVRKSDGVVHRNDPTILAALCPSMDLLAFARCSQMLASSSSDEENYNALENPSNSLHVFRVLSWQKLVEVSCTDLDGGGSSSVISALCWSPDGRACVVGCASNSVASTMADSCCAYLLDIENNGKVVHTIRLPGQRAVAGLAWAKRVVHPSYAVSLIDSTSEAWQLCQRYNLDRADHFLPINTEEVIVKNEALLNNPMNTFQQRNLNGSKKKDSKSRAVPQSIARNGTSNLPSSASVLSMLCVLSDSGDLYIFLFGRYLIAKIKNGYNTGARENNLNIVSSSDLSSILMYLPGRNLFVYDLPDVSKRHNELSWIGSSFSFIGNQLQIISNTLSSLTKLWKDSMRLLDMKFTLLRNLFKDYDVGADACPRSELLNMILTGNSKSNPSSDAIKLFFSNYMAEQGLQRIINTTTSGATAIETSLRSNVLKASHAILYSASEMLGLSKASKAWSDALPFFSTKIALEFHRTAEVFCIITEQCLVDLTTFRYRLNDLLRWFVGISAMIKAEVFPFTLIIVLF